MKKIKEKAKKIKAKKKPAPASKPKKKPTKKKAAKVLKKKTAFAPKKNKAEEADFSAKRVKIKVVGIGGGGGNIVSELSKKLKDFSSQKIDFVAANTDNQALNSLSKNVRTFAFGQKLTRGLGTGRDVVLGERAGREDAEKIKSIFAENKDLYIIVSSLGGGTGTGSAPIFAKIANDLGLTVLGIFTLPFAFEGKKKMDAAIDSLHKMKENLNAYMVLPNEKIFGLAKEEISFTDALNLLNSQLSSSLEGLLRTVYSPGLINIDWADIKTILEGKKKVAYLNIAKSKSSQNPDDFVKSLLKNPILEYKFENADNVLFNVEGSKNLSLQSLAQISRKISELAPNAKIIFGLTQNPKMKNELKITILATASEGKKEAEKGGPKTKPNSKKKKAKSDNLKNIKTSVDKEAANVQKKEEDKEKVEKEEAPEAEENIRRNALEIKEAERKAIEKEEEDEKIFEIPAFLRKKPR
ncbi:MAG: cell division protein FtsZ [Candidatus Paceibacterota bacterium]